MPMQAVNDAVVRKANRFIDNVWLELDKQDVEVWPELSNGIVPARPPKIQTLGAIRSNIAGYLLLTRDNRLAANRNGIISLRMIRAILKWIGMEHYEEYIWTPGLARKSAKMPPAPS